MSNHPIHPVLRVAIPLLRWPLVLYPAVMALAEVGSARYVAPLQKEFYHPVFLALWAILALLPFILVRRRFAYLAYCAAFSIVGGWLLYDTFAPFHYVAPDYHGTVQDAGGSYSVSATEEKCYYWVTRFVPSRFESWLLPALIVWPLLLGSFYHFAYARGHRKV